MCELNTTELNQVSGGFGLGAMVNSNITAILATNTGRNVAIQAASGMLNHAMYNLYSQDSTTGATVAGNASAGAATALMGAALGPIGTGATVALGGLGAAIGGAVQNALNQRMKALEEAEFYANGGV